MVFVFHSWYVMLGFLRNMKIFSSEDLFWSQSYWDSDTLHGNFRLLGNSMVVIQTLFTNVTLLCHKCWRVYWPSVTWQVCQLKLIVTGAHVGQEMLTLSGTPDFTPIAVFMISPIHYIHITECVSLRTMSQIHDWFAWINLTALSRTYFIIGMHHSIHIMYVKGGIQCN